MVMLKPDLKDTFRTIKKTGYRFISIFCIVALGVGFFAGIKASGPDMIKSTDIYSDEQNLMHFRLLSTWGFDDEDADALSALDGVHIKKSYFSDCMTRSGRSELETRFTAYDDGEDEINLLWLKEGRMPVSDDECVVDSASGCKIGSTVSVISEGAGDTLKNTEFKVVGSAYLGLYLSDYQRGTTAVGSGSLQQVIFIPKSNFISDYYTELFLVFDDMKAETVFTDGYDRLEEKFTDDILSVSEERKSERYEKTVAEINEKLSSAEEEIEENRKKLDGAKKELDAAASEIADGEIKIKEAEELLDVKRKELEDGKKQLEDSEAELKQKTLDAANAGTAIIEARRKYTESYEEYAEKALEAEKAIAAAKAETEDAQKQLDLAEPELKQAWETYNFAKGLYDKAYGVYTDALGEYERICLAVDADPEEKTFFKRQLDVAYEYLSGVGEYLENTGAELESKQKEYDDARAQLAAAKEELAREEENGRKELAAAKKKLEEAKAEIEKNEDLLISGTEQLEEAKALIEEGRIKISDGEKELSAAEEELRDKKAELENSKKQYSDGLAEYGEGLSKLQDAEEELENGKKTLSSLEAPVWYVFTRGDYDGYGEFGENAERMTNIAKVFPAFFILVAALVCVTGMTRMVDEERTQIGTLKALGYSNLRVIRKYMIYCLGATFAGCVVGLSVGYKLFPYAVIKAYGMLYCLRVIHIPFVLREAVVITLVSVALAAATVAVCCYKVTRPEPAKLMRAEAPAAGKRVLLERVGFIWKRLSFFGKVSVRNIFRYKKRMIMTLIGIMGCTALLLCGFALRDSISDVVGIQFDGVCRYNVLVMMNRTGPEEREELRRTVSAYDSASNGMFAMQKQVSVRNDKNKSSTYLFVSEDAGRASEMINFRDRKTGEEYRLEKGYVLITEKLASILNVKVGDMIEVCYDGVRYVEAPVGGIVENYIYHYVYFTAETYKALTGEDVEYNISTLRYSVDENTEQSMLSEINSLDFVLALRSKTELRRTFDIMMKALNSVIIVLIVSAALLAAVVLYNLASINIAERKREIATLEVLGFNDKEVSRYVFRESIALTVAGTAIGLLLGVALANYVIRTAEIDLVMFGRNIHFLSYVLSAALTVIFSLLVDLYMNKHIRRISMVESLKSID